MSDQNANPVKHVCGDCGDELIDNPNAAPTHLSVIEGSLGRAVPVRSPGEEGAYLHADGSPQCEGRADAIIHKPELLDRYYPGGLRGDNGDGLRWLMKGRDDLRKLVLSRDPHIQQIRELAGAIASEAEAIANDTITGSLFANVRRLTDNAHMLKAWTPDDRA